MDDREIVHRFRVQPGLNVAIEDGPQHPARGRAADGSEVIVRTGVLSDIDTLKDMLDLARVGSAAREDEESQAQGAALWEKTAPRRPRARAEPFTRWPGAVTAGGTRWSLQGPGVRAATAKRTARHPQYSVDQQKHAEKAARKDGC